MLAAIALWFVPMLLIVSQSGSADFEIYRDNILLKQTVTRYAASWHHVKPAWYYLTSVVPLFWLPACLAIPWLVKPWITAFKGLDLRIILPLGWVVLVIIFFSLSPGKRGVYIFPALPMLVLAIAPYYQLLLSKKWLRNGLLALVTFISIGLCVFALLGLMNVASVTKLADKIEITPWYFFFSAAVISLIGLIYAFRYNMWLAWPVFFSSFWIIYSTYGYLLRNEVSTPHSIYETAKPYIVGNAEIALVDFSEQFILFSPYPVYHFGYHTPSNEQLKAAYQWLSNEHRYLIIEDKLIDASCFDMAQGIDLGFAHRRHWMLLPEVSKKTDCKYAATQLPVYFYQSKTNGL
jgi:hypothetical protein